MKWTSNARTACDRLAPALGLSLRREGTSTYFTVPGVPEDVAEVRESSPIRLLARLVLYALLPASFNGPGKTPMEVSDMMRWDGRLPQGSNALPAHEEFALQRVLKVVNQQKEAA